MDWQRWIRSAEHQLDLLERSTIRAHAGHREYLEDLRELVKQVEDVHGRDEFPQGAADPLGHGFIPSQAEPTQCHVCTLRRIMHTTDDPDPERYQ